jgi:hypothetical protein
MASQAASASLAAKTRLRLKHSPLLNRHGLRRSILIQSQLLGFSLSVIPAKAGIQILQWVKRSMDTRLRGYDDTS